MGPHDSVEKRKKIESFVNNWNQNHDFDQLLVDEFAIDGIRNGFTVRKMQRGIDNNYVEELVIEVPAGS